jgi:hypothetical protein
MLERWTCRIDLLEVELQTFKDILFYLYNGYRKQESDLMGLLTLSDKYDIQELKCKYKMTLCTKVDNSSCVELLALADLSGQLLKNASSLLISVLLTTVKYKYYYALFSN